MKQRAPITKIMSTELVLLNLNDGLAKAENLFKKHNIRHIPVVNNNKIEGMLSYTDLLRISFADVADDDSHVESVVYDMFDIRQVMTSNVTCIDDDATIKEAAEILASREFHALPVVNKSNKVVGIVTTTDLIKYLLEQY